MKTVWAALLGGIAAGLIDIVSAFASFAPGGVTPDSILRYVASGLIGKAALEGGWATVILGLFVQVGLTTIMAGGFVLLSRASRRVLEWPWISGMAWGTLTCLAMNYVVVPISGAPNWHPPSGWGLVSALLAGNFYVGVPIACIAREFLAKPASTA